MTPRPLVLSPATPSKLLSHIIACHKYPTTLIIGCSKQDFLDVLSADVTDQITLPEDEDAEQINEDEVQTSTHPFLKASLYQIAISRHIRVIFAPTVTHFRAYLSIFSADDSKLAAPPNHSTNTAEPLLLIYGLLELHRGASEWSAQGIGNSAAILVEAAVRNAFKPVVVEPKGAGGHQDMDQILSEMVPLLNGTTIKADGSWSGRIVSTKRVLGRWFDFESREWNTK